MTAQFTPPTRARFRKSALLTAAILVGVATACSDTAPTMPTTRLSPRTPLFSAATLSSVPILWDQSIFAGTGHAHAHFGTMHADDFIVPAGTQWSVTQLMLAADHPRFYNGTAYEWIPATIQIRADDAGFVGAIIQSYEIVPVDTEGVDCTPLCHTFNNLYQLPAPVVLGPGTYWIAVGEANPSYEYTWYGGAPALGAPSQTSFEGGPWVSNETATTRFDFDFAVYGTNGTPANSTQNLQATVDGFGLPDGTANALDAKLRNALAAINAGDTAGACSALKDFINQVNALTGKKLTAAQASTLITAAESIRAQLGC
jgi:FIMAH domain-containing protein